jgi:hypothetical protein
MYQTRGYPIDFDLRRAHRAQRGPRAFPALRALAAYLWPRLFARPHTTG